MQSLEDFIQTFEALRDRPECIPDHTLNELYVLMGSKNLVDQACKAVRAQAVARWVGQTAVPPSTVEPMTVGGKRSWHGTTTADMIAKALGLPVDSVKVEGLPSVADVEELINSVAVDETHALQLSAKIQSLYSTSATSDTYRVIPASKRH